MNEPDPPALLPPATSLPDAPQPATPGSVHAYCANCGAPMYGEYCHACGQPIKGLVRHFSSVMGDVVDSVFNIDGRLFRTLPLLYLHPGRLTLEYFAGRRTRYVTPFRLVFFLAIIAFFSIQIAVRLNFEQVQILTTSQAPATTTGQSGASAGNDNPEATREKPPSTAWHQVERSLYVSWLPDFANAWLGRSVANAHAHIELLRHDNGQRKAEIEKLANAMFSVAPTVLFVLLPIFALMLKVFYIFKRRLYMEHLIVAMHSHAFLMLSMLVLAILAMSRAWLVAEVDWLAIPLTLLQAAAWVWAGIYLLLMQKRVYRQGWFMTWVKFACIGVCYSILLIFALLTAALIALAS